jgi:hypothetical protein
VMISERQKLRTEADALLSMGFRCSLELLAKADSKVTRSS